jgi:hypothetical protein
MIRGGKWCRNTTHNERTGQHCALGLIQHTIPGDYRLRDSAYMVLDAAIPESEFDQLRGRVLKDHGEPGAWRENGGYWRGDSVNQSRIASFNNTRVSERDVATWFEEALHEIDDA